MRKIEVRQLDYDLTPVGGLSLVGQYLKTLKVGLDELDRLMPVRSGVVKGDIVRAYLGLLVQGKSDFDAIEGYRGDKFFKAALGIGLLASSPTLRQRMDAQARTMVPQLPGLNEALLGGQRPDYGLLECGWLPLDVDTFAMDNSGTAKEGVGRTYVGLDGYCPLAAYLGAHGFCLELALRPGVQHSARETEHNLERVVAQAQRQSALGPKAPILARMDSGFDSAALMRSIEAHNDQGGLPQVDWLIKWNPRKVDKPAVLARLLADPATPWQHRRAGKRVAVWEEPIRLEGIERPVRRIFKLVERDIDSQGQRLLVPEVELEGWTTSLQAATFDAARVMALYADHGTHEKFHAEFKTDLDLERLPSGKFDTNYLVCGLAAIAMNILRLMGQRGLLGPDAPVRHAAKRRRLKTVMQELVYKAGRIIEHGRQLILGLGANDRAATAFMRLHAELRAASS